MKLLAFVSVWILTFSLSPAIAGEATSASLDEACQAAREANIAPLRKQMIDECTVNKEKKDKASCERYYRDYGERSGKRAGLFFDLPECVEAHNSKKPDR